MGLISLLKELKYSNSFEEGFFLCEQKLSQITYIHTSKKLTRPLNTHTQIQLQC